jgi:tRNA modification GTPase
LLQHAPTLRTASILLDQLNGAFATEVRRILGLLETDPPSATEPLRRLAELGNTVGRHLIEPWKVVVAGPPNVGKSSLVNALAGYQRSVVSEVAGTTRDAVSVRTAFDGWPIELIDTAGLRDAAGVEAEGIERARRVLAEADLVVWLQIFGTLGDVHPPKSRFSTIVWNKSDLATTPLPGIAVSAMTGAGIPQLAEEIVARLVPNPPPGVAAPFSPQLAALVEGANAALLAGRPDEAARLLREALAAAE